jgi:hypothetical protein
LSREAPPRESVVVGHILNYLRTRGAFAEKIHGDYSQSALLDIIACYRSVFIHLEVKRAAGIPATPRQQYIIQKVKEAGGISTVVHSVDEVAAILSELEA